MEFLFKSRSEGKRQIKPSQDIQYLEDQIAQESSEDSDFKIDSDHEGEEEEDDDDEEEEEDDNDEEEEDEGSEEEGGGGGGRGRVNEPWWEGRKGGGGGMLRTSDLLSISREENKKKEEMDDSVLFKRKICACCLGESSNDANEIVECDGCGISVHEGCYGVTESGSVASTVSEASTEPWFCEPCQAGLMVSPPCELCPVIGGVYKETDVGRWVHLVCALYVHGVAFGDPDKLTAITVFEMNYSNWGRKACMLCEQSRFARTGICIQCDAGLCKSVFHATCAQANGLLAEPAFTETDPYIAHCRLHSDKSLTKSRKITFFTTVRQTERRRSRIRDSWKIEKNVFSTSSRAAPGETPAQRIMRKLNRRRSRFVPSKRDEPVIPLRKMPRLLSSSSSAIRKMQRLTELTSGLNPDRQRAREAQYIAIHEIQKKWHLSPSFNVEFVAYYHDRQSRLRDLKSQLSEQLKTASILRTSHSEVRKTFEKANQTRDEALELNASLRKQVEQYRNTLNAIGLTLPPVDELLFKSSKIESNGESFYRGRSSKNHRRSSHEFVNLEGQLVDLKKCGICSGTNDQHLLVLCDTCSLHYHLGCLSPPLSRMPKRSKLYTWQCSECDKLSSGDEKSNVDISGPRKLRQKRVSSSQLGNDSSDDEVVFANHERQQSINGSLCIVAQSEEQKMNISGESPSAPDTDKAERKKLKKERKKERRKKKMEVIEPKVINEDSSDGVEILEDEHGQCTVRIKPKPIKLKIKNLLENSSPVPPEDESQQKSVLEPSISPKRKKKRMSADAKDIRTLCSKCQTSGQNSNLVRCDECKKCYHFTCLIPPVKKSPKVAGYGWHCNDCDPSDVDSDWHLD